MNGIQLDLFTFAAMQSQEQPIKAEPVIVPKNFINDGKYPLPTVKSERIAANLKAIRLLKSLSEERPLEYDEQITLSRMVFRSSMQEASKDTKKITPVWKLTATSPMESTICSLKFSKRSFDIMKKVYQQCCKCKTIYESDCKVVPYAYCIMKNCGGLVPYEASRQEELKNKFNKTERKTK